MVACGAWRPAPLLALALVAGATAPSGSIVNVKPAANSTQAVNVTIGIRDRFSALQQRSEPLQIPRLRSWPLPKESALRREGSRFLTYKELAPIMTIRCLQEKQQHPHLPCGKLPDEKFAPIPLSISHYPSWREYACHSNSEFFCDPNKLLSKADNHAVTEHLRLFKEQTLVNCGQLDSIMDPDAKRRWYEKKHPVYTGRLDLQDYRHFNLAIALADEWPSMERDPKSLEYFGRVLMSQWGLMPIYNGVDNGNGVNQHYSWTEYYSSCPNTAILMIFPKYDQVYLYTPSCEYLCETRGGPEIIAATLHGLKSGGVKEAITAGIDAMARVMKVATPLSIQKVPVKKMWRGSMTGKIASDDTAWIVTMRVLYAFVIFLFAATTISFVYFVFYYKHKDASVSTLQRTGRTGQREVTFAIMHA